MSALELKLPPPLVMVIVAVLMWLAARNTSAWAISFPGYKVVALCLLVIGIVIAVVAAIEFRRAATTINPMNPKATTQLITSGLYQFSRNPIYVADVFVLLAFGIYLKSLLGVLLIAVFVLYINRFQIDPEELFLEQHFDEHYRTYKTQVRRWI